MRRLTEDDLDAAFPEWGVDVTDVGAYSTVINRARRQDGIELQQALAQLRRQKQEVEVFVEKVLVPSDLANIEPVIDMLAKEIDGSDWWNPECLRLLQAWRAKVLMQIVIDKRNAINGAAVKLGANA